MKGHLRLLFNKTIHVQDRITCIKYTKLLIHLVIKLGITLGCYEPGMTVYFPPLHRWGNCGGGEAQKPSIQAKQAVENSEPWAPRPACTIAEGRVGTQLASTACCRQPLLSSSRVPLV